MRPAVDQVNEFIEGLFDGSIVTVRSDPSREKGLADNLAKVAYADLTNAMSQLIGELIPLYKKANGADKEPLADKIFIIVVSLRANGLLSNNPDNLKELTYYKTRCAELVNKVNDLTETIMALKAGKSGII